MCRLFFPSPFSVFSAFIGIFPLASSPCESGFVFTTTETNNFHATNIKKEGKTLSCVLFSSKTCSIIKYRNPNDSVGKVR